MRELISPSTMCYDKKSGHEEKHRVACTPSGSYAEASDASLSSPLRPSQPMKARTLDQNINEMHNLEIKETHNNSTRTTNLIVRCIPVPNTQDVLTEPNA